MALFAQQMDASKKWLVLVAFSLLAVGLLFASTSTLRLGSLSTRRKASAATPSAMLEEHFEALRVIVDDVGNTGEADENVAIGGEVDYGDYTQGDAQGGADDGDDDDDDRDAEVDNADFLGDSVIMVEDLELQPADYEEEDVSRSDLDAEEVADYGTEGLDEGMDDEEYTKPVEDIDTKKAGEAKDLRAYDLTRERAVKAARQADGTLAPVVVTWANFHYLDFALNWVHHMKKTGCTTYLVGAMDDELLEVLLKRGVPAFGMSSGLSLDDFGWGTQTFFKMGREKISLLQQFTRWGLDVIVSDVDTVWLRNPLPYMAKYPDADVLISSDHLLDTTGGDEGLEHYPDAGSPANIGVMLFRPRAAGFVDQWMRELLEDDQYWDQNAFNDLMRMGMDPEKMGKDDFSDSQRLFKAYNETLRMGILPVSMFCSGHTFFIQDLPGRLGVEPYVVHATFQYSATIGKRNRFRERLMWLDEDEYFRHETGFIATTYKVSERLLDATVKDDKDREDNRFDIKTTLPHFRLVNQQIETVRALLALGQTMNRAMVMPKLFCGLDRWWGPHDGHIPGARLPQLPFMCPLDYVFNLEVLDRGEVRWKESSFLENPKAASIASRKLRIITCNEESAQCDDGSKQATMMQVEGGGESIVKLRAKRTDKQIARALEGIAEGFDLIEFDNPSKLWSRFEDRMQNDWFNQLYMMATDLWCCVEPEQGGQVGHIWYDFLAGTGEAHADRWGRWIDMNPEWIPQRGP